MALTEEQKRKCGEIAGRIMVDLGESIINELDEDGDLDEMAEMEEAVTRIVRDRLSKTLEKETT